MEEKKIAVVGVGGVGGCLAALLARTFPHVTVVARNARGEAIREKGLILHSDQYGEVTARPERVVGSAAELGAQDLVFVCVKNYSLEEACRELRQAVTESTVVVPVMNGTDPGERARALLGRGLVVDALIYIVAFANPDFSVTHQGDFSNIRVGVRDAGPAEAEAVREAAALLTAAGIDCKASEDIELEIWRKYILNCAYNVTTAFYDNSIGQLRDDPQKAAEYEALVWEACKVAEAKGVRVRPEHGEQIIRRFYHELQYDATSSLQRDIRAKRPSELETFSGYLVREAERLGVPVPVSRRMYEGLRELAARARTPDV